MFLIEVTPFTKVIKNDSLSYFSTQPVNIGSIVTVPLRNKDVKGLVISSKPAKNLKTEIKNSTFQIKKIKGVSKNIFLTNSFILTSEEVANYFATSSGSVIRSLIPDVVLENIDKLSKSNDKTEIKDKKKDSLKYILQAPDSDRYSEYKSIVREKFAQNQTVLFCAPTIEDVYFAKENLSRGIENHTFILHSKLNKTEIIRIWNEIIDRDKPSLIIMTCGFLGIPISNIGLIITERESSSSYKTKRRPYFDLRFFIEKYAIFCHADLILGDLMLRAETLWRYDNGEFIEQVPIKFRSISDATSKIVNIKEDSNGIYSPEKMSKVSDIKFLSNYSIDIIKSAISKNERTLIITNRKGLSPVVICADCGEIVKCKNCDSPVILYGKNKNQKCNFLKCKICGSKRSAEETCVNCNSWRLMALGAGTEKIEKEIKSVIEGVKTNIIDRDHSQTVLKSQKIAKEFYETPAGILIGTEMALLYLHDQIENVIISSIDSMFALPDFRIKERIVNIILRARSLAGQKFVIQTRNPEEKIFKNVTEGNLTDFYRQEFIERKKYNYPPFSLIIKISLTGKNEKYIIDELEGIKKMLEPHEVVIYPSFIEMIRGQKIINAMMRIPTDEWPNKDIIYKLKNLGPQFKIEVDAESVL